MFHRFFFHPEEQLNEADPFSSFAEDLYKMQNTLSIVEFEQSGLKFCDSVQVNKSPTQIESDDEKEKNNQRQPAKLKRIKRKREDDDYDDEKERKKIKKEALDKKKKPGKNDINKFIVEKNNSSVNFIIKAADDAWQTLVFDEQGNCKVSLVAKR